MIECDDLLVHVGQEARITARLRLGSILRLGSRLKGRVISFYGDGEKIGESITGPDGFAALTYSPPEEKEYRLVACYEGPRRSRGAAAQATIFSRSARKQGIVLDIDGTLSASSTFGSVVRKNRRVHPLEGAADVTRALRLKYDLIVLTGRRSYLRRKTRNWLEENGFPSLPIFFPPRGRLWWQSEKFKTDLLARLKRDWPNISIGIGDRDSDARAYLANGLKAILIRKRGRCPPGAVAAAHWEAIRRMLLD